MHQDLRRKKDARETPTSEAGGWAAKNIIIDAGTGVDSYTRYPCVRMCFK